MYCQLADLLNRVPESVLIRLTDDEALGVVNQGRIDQAIADAGAEIDSYARSRYPVPFDPVPVIIRKLAADIALYNLLSRRGYEQDSPDQALVERYKAAVKFLENLARGTVTIGDAAPAPAPAAGGAPDLSSNERVFTRRNLEGF